MKRGSIFYPAYMMGRILPWKLGDKSPISATLKLTYRCNLSSETGSGKIDFIRLEENNHLLASEPALIYQRFGLLTYRFLALHLYLATVGWF